MKTKTSFLAIIMLVWLTLTNASAFYGPGVQRWINRDPIAELGGVNLYSFGLNRPVSLIDRFGFAPNKEGATSGCHVSDQLRNDPSLANLRDNHGDNSNRYFYTDTYGWVDIRHFAEGAARARSGEWGWWTKMLGFGLEISQWLDEWGDDYRSGFSPEDLPSNSAGVDFGKSIGQGESLGDAFDRWAEKHGARTPDDPKAGFNKLPATDPSFKGGKGRGSNTGSENPKPATPTPKLTPCSS